VRALTVVLLGLFASVAFAAAEGQSGTASATPGALGRWITANGDGVVEIYRAPDGTLEGKIVQGKHPDRLDEKNPDPALRARKVVGTVIMRGMKPDDASVWSGGTIYDPDTGNTYRCKLTLREPDVLDLRGYIGISLFGRTSRWTRAKE
jgi:uncharacterized protein (DUF2147 family)